ncbi:MULTISPECIES: Lrp/AsnC family transcriptional regulator [Kordiimonas]|jgi:Lrp/AsnC family transcriptional regulator of ectoine degradation|uniref:Lrp/AsnC family transcriptional regulator n=1 Tax=Kordiimonas TaxID=288021 RepID=UPI00257B4655|nr:Lrp/AsnC family transcriptional regulator [Kordiimonas sp. UBA4487]
MTTEAFKIDKINRRILEVLQLDARISNIALADAVHLSPSACLERVKKLEQQGFITRYLGEIAVTKIAPLLESYAEVTLSNHRPEDFRQFHAAVKMEKAIVQCHKVSGRYDYLIRIAVRDMAALSRLTDRLLGAGIGIAKFTTVPIIENPKPFGGYPLEELLDGA